MGAIGGTKGPNYNTLSKSDENTYVLKVLVEHLVKTCEKLIKSCENALSKNAENKLFKSFSGGT